MMSTKIVILGSSGLVGQAFLQLLKELDVEAVTPGRRDFEVRSSQTMISSSLIGEMNKYPIIDLLHSNDWQISKEIKLNQNYLAEIAKKIDVRKIETPYIYFSSGAVYGPSSTTISDDSHVNLTNSYADYKFMMESECRSKFMNYKIFRLFFPYGKSQRPERLIPRLLSMIERGVPVNCNHDGGPSISIIDVRDVAQVLFEELKNPWCGTRNLAGGEVVNIRKLAIILGKSIGVEPKFEENLDYAENYVVSPYDERRWRQLRDLYIPQEDL